MIASLVIVIVILVCVYKIKSSSNQYNTKSGNRKNAIKATSEGEDIELTPLGKENEQPKQN